TFFRENASLWWRNLGTEITDKITWDEFEKQVIAQFSPINAVSNARDKLAALEQTTSVHKYIADFNSLTLQIPNMTDEEKIHKFKYGLKRHIRTQIELQPGLTTLGAVIQAAN